MSIKTKRGNDFSRDSLRNLLTNPRYIGKWHRNKHNADKRQNKLRPYERFVEVELAHGSVVDEGLWQRVQDKVKELEFIFNNTSSPENSGEDTFCIPGARKRRRALHAKQATPSRLERETLGLEGRCSIQLSYGAYSQPPAKEAQ